MKTGTKIGIAAVAIIIVTIVATKKKKNNEKIKAKDWYTQADVELPTNEEYYNFTGMIKVLIHNKEKYIVKNDNISSPQVISASPLSKDGLVQVRAVLVEHKPTDSFVYTSITNANNACIVKKSELESGNGFHLYIVPKTMLSKIKFTEE